MPFPLRLCVPAVILFLFLFSSLVFSQEENVPVGNPVYLFLKRMEVKGIIERYQDAVLPLSRREVARHLSSVAERNDGLTGAEREWLVDFLSEFRYDVSGTTAGLHRLIDSEEPTFGAAAGMLFSGREKYLYAHADSTVSFFVNGLLDFDARRIRGDALGPRHAEFLQAGGRIRGTILGHLGYYAQWTNAQFWGSKELLGRDPLISQSFALQVTNIQNFDFAESYLRYGNEVVSAQVGRERVLWGTGYDQKMTLSENPRAFDFLRFDARYKGLKYTFMHAWLVGTPGRVQFSVPSDTTSLYAEEIAADKYFVAHRLDIAFGGVLTLGLQEMLIYGNRAPDLAYLNPLTIIESSQRSRGERDNAYWALDLKLHCIPRVELTAGITYDDINVPDLFTSVWSDRYAWQAGLFYADVFGIENTNLMVEYTRIEPFVYSHARSREGSYTNLDRLLGLRIGPNADSWFFRTDFLPERNLMLSARVSFVRKGENVLDAAGLLVRNVGSNPFVPHRDVDPRTKKFLDGELFHSGLLEFLATWEIVNQIWLDARYQYDWAENRQTGAGNRNHLIDIRLRTEF